MGSETKLFSRFRTHSPKSAVNTTTSRQDVASIGVALEQCSAHEKEMDKMMTEITKSSKTNYQFKANTNAILVIIGTILIASPIAFTWLRSTDMIPAMSNDMDLTNLNYFLGGIGIVAFVTTFYNKPQSRMTIAIADLAQFSIICNMYRLQFHSIAQMLAEQSTDGRAYENQGVINKANESLHKLTEDTAKLIDDYIEKHARSEIEREIEAKKASKHEARPPN